MTPSSNGGAAWAGARGRTSPFAVSITGLEVSELQADEVRTIAGRKERAVWIFATIDVSSRLWPTTFVGQRSYRNTLALFRDTARRSDFRAMSLIVTHGFEFYEKVVRRVFGPACPYAQVLKTRRRDRTIRVQRRQLIGAASRFKDAPLESEDSSTLNTSFFERLNFTIRQGFDVSDATHNVPRPAPRATGEPARNGPPPLQVSPAAQNTEVRSGDQDAGHAGRADPETTLLPRHLHLAADSGTIEENCLRARPCRERLGDSGVVPHS